MARDLQTALAATLRYCPVLATEHEGRLAAIVDFTFIFGATVTGIVLEVTDDKSLDKAVRKEEQVRHASHISPEAKLVKLADKICNLRDILASPPADWSADRKRAYFDWAARVVAGLRGVHPTLEAVFDGLYGRQAELL